MIKAFRKLPKKKQQYLILIVLVLLTALSGMWLFYISPALSSASDTSAKIKDLEAKIEDLEKQARLDAHNQPMIEQIAGFVRPLGKSMVQGDPYMWVVRQLRLREEQSPVRVNTIRPGGVSDHPRQGSYEVYTTEIEIDGQYDEIGAFIQDLENAYPTSELRSVVLSRADAGPGPVRRARVQMAFLIYPEKKMGRWQEGVEEEPIQTEPLIP